ncbi:sulfatase [Chryseobacterium sp. RU33C]|uniref:sulfatase n=1 Tax=Chryseobacterium sp. RU33C TaxID=1907398 RepID=UPI000956C16E|nr:sulfatase [Chryseobacterium sp. RU33C]SIR08853.1 Arylsulfatase A [Chryseobacterium sp. RU33C]
MKNFNFLRIVFIISICNYITISGGSFHKDNPKPKKSIRSNAKQTRPNILFIPIDDLRPEMGCYGNTVIKTPNMDKLAAKGVVFNRAYCQQAVCNPSRASLLTGLRPDSVRVWDLQTDFRKNLPDAITLPQAFKNNGYYTVGIGKTFHNNFPDDKSWNEELHVAGYPFDPDAVYQMEKNKMIQKEKELGLQKIGKARPDAYGFVYTKANSVEMADVDDDAYYDGAQTTMAIQKLKELKGKDKPFFFSVGYYRPHLPFNAPKKYWDLYNRNDIPLAKNQFMPENAPEFAVHGDTELRAYTDRSDLPLPSEKPYDIEKQRELLHGYYASVSYTDAQIGRLLKALDELELSENTIIVLWGDHGWKLGEHNSWCKQSNYEIDTRVPLIISGAGVKAKGKTSDALTEFVDIYPTLCDMAGIKIPDYLQGTSMKPLLTDPARTWKTAAYSQFLLGRFGVKARGVQNVERMGYAIRTDRYRYVEWFEWNKETGKPGAYLARELYDHKNDPDENVNIAEEVSSKKLVSQLSLQMKKGWRYSKPKS